MFGIQLAAARAGFFIAFMTPLSAEAAAEQVCRNLLLVLSRPVPSQSDMQA